jgi:hypothetical protein
MEPGLEMDDLARRVRELLSAQGFGSKDVIHFATLLLDNVVGEVKVQQSSGGTNSPTTSS